MHEEFGVVDPLDPPPRGPRAAASGCALRRRANTSRDFIFGKEIKDGGGRRYVRVPGQKQTLVIKAKPDISVKFEDWVETDLLRWAGRPSRKVAIDKYSLRREQGGSRTAHTYLLAQDDSNAPWKLSGQDDKEDSNTETIDDGQHADEAEARRRARQAARGGEGEEPGRARQDAPPGLIRVAQSMIQHGFFIMQRRQPAMVVSNEARCPSLRGRRGLHAALRRGAGGHGEEISAGATEPKPKDKKDEKKDDKKGGTENRYLFVGVSFDESLLPALPPEPKPYVADPAKKPEEQKADEEKAKKDKESTRPRRRTARRRRKTGRRSREARGPVCRLVLRHFLGRLQEARVDRASWSSPRSQAGREEAGRAQGRRRAQPREAGRQEAGSKTLGAEAKGGRDRSPRKRSPKRNPRLRKRK
jgi:hypothetical protein